MGAKKIVIMVPATEKNKYANKKSHTLPYSGLRLDSVMVDIILLIVFLRTVMTVFFSTTASPCCCCCCTLVLVFLTGEKNVKIETERAMPQIMASHQLSRVTPHVLAGIND